MNIICGLLIAWMCFTLVMPVLALYVLVWAHYSPFRTNPLYPDPKLEKLSLRLMFFWFDYSLLSVLLSLQEKAEEYLKTYKAPY